MDHELIWKPTLQQAESVWALLDRDKSGSVDANELTAIVRLVGDFELKQL